MFSNIKIIGILAAVTAVLAGLVASIFLYWRLRVVKAENETLKKNVELISRTRNEERNIENETRKRQQENTQRIQAAMAGINHNNVVHNLNKLYSR